MAKKIVLAELDIDFKALLKSTQQLSKSIEEVKASQKRLKDSGNQTSKLYIQQEAELKVLNKQYRDSVKIMSERIQKTEDAENREEELNAVLAIEANTIEGLRAQNKALNKLRNSANILTAEGRQELESLNAKLDENNEKIKENVDQYTQQKINIGNYKDSIKEAFEELNIFNGGLTGFIARSRDAGGVGNLLTNSFKGISQGIIGMTKASIAFIATPLGAVLTAVVATVALFRNALNRSEESTNKFTRAIAPLTGLFKKVLKELEPVGEFLIDVFVKSLELAEKNTLKFIRFTSSALEKLGFEDASESVSKFADQIEETTRLSKELADAEAQLTKNQRETRLVQLEYLRDAEKLRQIRDDENLSIRERIEANEQLGQTLQKQIREELALAEQALRLTDLRIQQEGETSDLLDERAERLIEIADIQERITGQESEQLVNRVSLQKEAADKAKERIQQEVETMNQLIDLYIAEAGIRKKSDEDEIRFQQELAQKRIEVLEFELKQKEITLNEYNATRLEIEQELARQLTDIVVENAEQELQDYVAKNQQKIESDKFFTQEALQVEQQRLEAIAEKRREFEALRFERGLINEEEYNRAINQINEENRVANEEAQLLRDEAEKEKKLIDLENQRILDEENFRNDYELKLARLEQQKQAEIENAEETGANIALIEEKYANQKRRIDEAYVQSKLASLGATFGMAKNLLNKESALFKAVSFGQALINTYQGITAGLKLGFPAAIPAVAYATFQGFQAVRQIASTRTQFRKGGIGKISGPSHEAGGVPIYAGNQYIGEAEGDEGIGILNKAAFKDFMSYNNSFLSKRSKDGRYPGGGIITSTIKPTNNSTQIIEGISEVLQELPAPVVTVVDIDKGLKSKTLVESGANS